MSLYQISQFNNKLEGKDKMFKLIENLTLLTKEFYKTYRSKNIKYIKNYNNLFNAIFNSRRFFELFNTLNEINKIKKLLKSTNDDEFDRLINIMKCFLYGIYWFLDNLFILSFCEFIRLHPKPFLILGLKFELIGKKNNLIKKTKKSNYSILN